jgi:hypothetical protein
MRPRSQGNLRIYGQVVGLVNCSIEDADSPTGGAFSPDLSFGLEDRFPCNADRKPIPRAITADRNHT